MTMLTASFDRAEEGAYDRMTQAWQWLCEQRTQAPDHADVWDIRWQNLNTGERWLTDLTERVLRGEYRLTPLQLQGTGEQRKAVWGAQDALVLKWAALSLQHLLPLHESCEHVKGHGGGKQSIEKLHSLLTAQSVDSEKKTAAGTTPDAAEIRHYKWVCRTDIRGYYRNINKQTLIQQVRQHVTAPVLRDLVQQYIHYTVEHGGTFHTPEKGISRGCPLSPLMGALHLFDMDEHFSNQPNIHYARYMDDIIILAKTRWSLRKHTKRLMQWFGEYGFEAHPDKTQIGRTAKGFDWMGARLTHEGVTDVAPRAKANHREKARRLYEQLARLPKWKRKSAAPKVHARVSTYRKRWNIWSLGLLSLLVVSSIALGANDGGTVMITGQGKNFTPSSPVGTVTNTRGAYSQGLKTVVNYTINPAVNPYLQANMQVLSNGNTTITGIPSLAGNLNGNSASGMTIFTNPTLQSCGLGFSASMAFSVMYGGIGTSSSPNIIGGASTGSSLYMLSGGGQTRYVDTLNTYVGLTYIGAKTLTTCPLGTPVASICVTLDPVSTSQAPAIQPSPVNSCPSKGAIVTYVLGEDYNPPAAVNCTLHLTSPSTIAVPDITVSGAGGGAVIAVAPPVTGDMSCNNSVLGNVPVNLRVTWAMQGPDFKNAGFNGTTATYIGLLPGATNEKATVGTILSDGDLLTNVSDPSAPGAQNFAMTPVVISGTGGPLVGAGTVVGTLTAVVR
jgi:hypothetical protein